MALKGWNNGAAKSTIGDFAVCLIKEGGRNHE